ncbi:unnamed protein product [Symbiodinium natans]|uniref:Uncharacterized protein n=1 Tax=Symbiodinium natans TaxID=878477 RepID=A0A812MS83_9DINO|nr:unnamed protein product [Symbiodinium natans]
MAGAGAAARLRGGGAEVEAPKPPEAKKKKEPKEPKESRKKHLKDSKDLKEVKDSWGKVDELDDRQKHDMALLGKQTDVLRSTREPKKKRRSEKAQLDPSIREILEKYGEVGEGSESPSLQMQQALKELARQFALMQERAEAAEEATASVQAQLETESASCQKLDQERLLAMQRVEELELQALDAQAKQAAQAAQAQAAQAKACKEKGSFEAKEGRHRELEALLKEAILRGARLNRLQAAAAAAQGEAERRAELLQRQLARLQRRAQRDKAQRLRLEAALRGAERRGDRAEARLGEALRAAAEGGASKVLEAHVQHLAAAGTSLAAKVDEQAEIIDVLRSLLQDHKDFIRQQLGTELALPDRDAEEVDEADQADQAEEEESASSGESESVPKA